MCRFDSYATPEAIARYGSQIDFVWGATPHTVAQWAKASHASIMSYYMPYSRDPAPGTHLTPDHNSTSGKTGLAWWQQHHPSLILYRCDRKTPAWECFSGEGCSHDNVPLDLTNPETLDYQMSAGVAPAHAQGYTAIAFDNFGLANQWQACGAYKGGSSGTEWVQLYDAPAARDGGGRADAKYQAAVLDWLARAVRAIHDLGMLVIPNFSAMDFSAGVLAVANLTDGILAEGGFTTWNPVPHSASMTQPPLKTNPAKFQAQVKFIRNLQRHGKAFFAINEVCSNPPALDAPSSCHPP